MNAAVARAACAPLLAAALAACAAPSPPPFDGARLQTAVGDRIGPGGAVVVRALTNDFHDDGGRCDFTVANEGREGIEILDVDVELGFPAPEEGFDAPYRPFHFDHVEWEDVAPGESRSGSVTIRGTGARPLFSRLTVAPHGRPLVARSGSWAGTCFLGWTVECVDLVRETTAAEPRVRVTLENTDAQAAAGAPPRALLWRVRFLRDGEPVDLPGPLRAWRPLPEPLGGERGARTTLVIDGLEDVPGVSTATLVLQLRTAK